MNWQGNINFMNAITLRGKPHGIEHLEIRPLWTEQDYGRVIHSENDGKLWFGGITDWEELTPGGVGIHDHDDRYYLDSEVDGMFEGKNGLKQTVNWINITNKPNVYNSQVHDNSNHIEQYITTSQVTFDNLNANGDIGTNADQVASGNHTHNDLYYTKVDGDARYAALVHTHTSQNISYDNSISNLTATTVKDAIDELDAGVDRADIVITREYWVDKTSPGTYTPTGSRLKPFKSINDALLIASPGSSVYVGAGTYTENFTIPNRVSVHGAGLSKTILMGNGTIEIGDGQPNATTHMTGFSIRQHVNINMVDGKVIFRDTYISNEGWVTVTSGSVDGLSISTTSGNPALTIDSMGTISCFNAILSSNAVSTIVHNNGILSLNNCTIRGNSVEPTIISRGGQFASSDSFIINVGGGLAIDINNGASPLAPNILNDIIHSGGIETGSAITIIEGVNGGKPVSSIGELNHLYTPASMTSYDGTSSGLVAKNVQSAIDEVTIKTQKINITSGIPVDTPDIGSTRFDSVTNTLYIFNGTNWVGTILS